MSRSASAVRYLDIQPGDPVRIGLAHGPIVAPFLDRHRGLVDYVEVPFEQLRHAPATASIQEHVPVVLHCASMSTAGFVPATDETLADIEAHAQRTRTPWIGEHLAFLSAAPLSEVGQPGRGAPVELTYTICPQLSEATVERVADNLERLRAAVTAPLILENSPQYFPMPGSTMSMSEFVSAVAERCDIDLLLDLTHFVISARNLGFDALEAAQQLPLERVREVHVSGMSYQAGRWWDDHSAPAPEAVFELLEGLAERLAPQAVTFEYNWADAIPASVVVAQIQRTREVLAA